MVLDASELFYKQEQEERLRQSIKPSNFSRKITEIYPNKAMTPSGFIKQKYNQFEVFKIKSYNLFGMTQQEVESLIYSYEMLSILYTQPLKIVCINKPLYLDEQIKYTKYLLKHATSDVVRMELRRRLNVFKLLENSRQQKEFYVFVYGYTDDILQNNISEFLSSTKFLEIEPLTKEDKEQLLAQMTNLGMKVDWKGERI